MVGHDAAHQIAARNGPDAELAGGFRPGGDGVGGAHPAACRLVWEPALLCRGRSALDGPYRAGFALDVCGAQAMIDNDDRHSFEAEENGKLVFANYREQDGRFLLTHV